MERLLVVGTPREGRKKALTPAQVKARYRRKKKVVAMLVRRDVVLTERAEGTAKAKAKLETNTKLYSLLLCDPPWHTRLRSPAGMSRSPDVKHYPTMTLDALVAMAPLIPAAKDSLMFMWTTSTHLAESMRLLEAWGFEYIGFEVWDKQIIGKGNRNRLQAELVLIGKKDNGLPAPIPSRREPNFFSIRRSTKPGEHSVKPREYVERLDRLYPGVPRVEMFAREHPGKGWDTWGNEAADLAANR
jgi:N6-adenosine-specific RNA methylase IME4